VTHARQRRFRIGFSLIEVLLVLAILGILVGLLCCGVQAARTAAATAACKNNLRNTGFALHCYVDGQNRFPPGCAYPLSSNPKDGRQIAWSWQTALLPLVEQSPLFEEAWAVYVRDPTGQDPRHASVGDHSLSIFRCPSDPRVSGIASESNTTWGLTNYIGVSGTHIGGSDGVLFSNGFVRAGDIRDGMSNTVMVGERPANPFGVGSAWYSTWNALCPCLDGTQILPGGINTWANLLGKCHLVPNGSPLRPGYMDDYCDSSHFWSLHGSGANFAFCDGSVRFLSYGSTDILPLLATRAGGESFSIP
jgi:prepilin-type processing-associated H-X9-DG protein/prepilin-type N-terminal cleavage/methylation domain-containing protein